jgi:DNA polymerase
MAESIDSANLRRQLAAHLENLRGAGIEWLPQGPPLVVAASAPSAPMTVPMTAPPQISPSATPMPVSAAVSVQQSALPGYSELSPEAAELTMEQRRIGLAQLAEEVKTCTRCPELCSTRRQTVFADGQPGVELCFIGEAPGEDEDRQGLPFVGAAGQLLNRIIAACGMKREEVYIMNVIKCHPPRNRTPLPNEAANCRSFFDRQLDLVRPKYICALGGCAASNILSTTLSIGKLRGRFHEYRGIPVLVTYHPAFLLPHRSPAKKGEVWEDMQFLMKRMGRTIPERKTE